MLMRKEKDFCVSSFDIDIISFYNAVCKSKMEDAYQPAGRMYLAFDQWSPRFEAATFYSIKVEGFEMLQDQPSSPSPPIGGKSNFPAYYYRINVYSGRSMRTIYRRYSQFYWLYERLCRSFVGGLSIPKGSCLRLGFCQNESFAQTRLEELRDFLYDALEQPNVASHPSVVAFLELDKI